MLLLLLLLVDAAVVVVALKGTTTYNHTVDLKDIVAINNMLYGILKHNYTDS